MRGTEGPLIVADPRMQHPLSDAFIASMAARDVRRNADYNSGDQEGAGCYQYLMKEGMRWSAADAYLKPALKRSNLTLSLHSRAMRMVFEGRRAAGVEFRRGGATRIAHATREVILAGGTINSPQLLQLSGIGDPALLARYGIKLVHRSPNVGTNLIDHYAVRLAARVKGAQTLNERAHRWRLLCEVFRYAARREVILASAPSHAFGFVRAVQGATRSDNQLLFTPTSYESGRVGQAALERLPGLSCGVAQLRPHSRGFVRIVSADPFAAPAIQPNYLANERDCTESGNTYATTIMIAEKGADLLLAAEYNDHPQAMAYTS